MPQPYRLKHRNYVVEYDIGEGGSDVDVFDVRVLTADVLDAEQAGPTYGITDPTRQAVAMNTMWLWAAARRMGRIAKNTGWPEFRTRCLDWRPAEDAEVPVPPTQPGALTGSFSTSAPDSSAASTSTDGAVLPARMSGSSQPPSN